MFAGLFGSVIDWSHTCTKSLAPKFVLLNLVSSASDLLNQGSTVIQHMASYCIIKLACVQICVLEKWNYVSCEGRNTHSTGVMGGFVTGL
jgi:hypothetical protein